MSKCNIVIANYNYSEWIEDCIESAINQTYKDTIISVVDDCSTDNSVKIALKTFGIDSEPTETEQYKLWTKDNFQVFQLKKNSGPSTARNTAILHNINTCTFFSALDADDYIYNNKIEILIKELTKFNGVGCIYADYDILNVKTRLSLYEYKRTYSFAKLLNECIVHSGCLFTREALVGTVEETGFYDIRIKGPEDYDLWLRIAEKFMILHYPQSLTCVRTTGVNISNTAISGNSDNYKIGFEILNRKLQERNARNSVNR
jgi:glycosyltransferase involved in cell wall biosynthesis